MTREHSIQAEYRIGGMCYFSGRLYTTEVWKGYGSNIYRLAVYSVIDQNTVTLLDTLDLEDSPTEPRLDRQSGRVYISCKSRSIYVVRYDGSKLVLITTLRCMGKPHALAVVSPDTLYVYDDGSNTVYLPHVTEDRVTARLQNPVEVAYSCPFTIAILGDTILVGCENNELVIHRHGVPTPGKLLPKPQGLEDISSLTTDHHSSFLLVDVDSNTLFVLDIRGNLTHTISIPGDRDPRGCTVVGGQLWVGCGNGDIIVMSSQ